MKRVVFKAILVVAMTIALTISSKVWAVDSTYPIHKGNWYAAAGMIGLAAPIESDVMAVGKQVDIHTNVGGDVLAAAGKIRVADTVAGNVRVVGGEVELAGTVGRNVTVLGGTVIFTPESRVLGHVLVAGGTVKFNGAIDGSVKAAGQNIFVNGKIAGPVELWLDRKGNLEIGSAAVTRAEFIYHASNKAVVNSQAKLTKAPEFKLLSLVSGYKYSRQWWLRQLTGLFSLFVLAMVAVKLMPKKIQEVAEEGVHNFWRSLGWGALWVVAVPIVCLLLLFTVIGMSLSVVLGAVYIIGALLSQVMVGAIVGNYLQKIPQLVCLKKWSVFPLLLLGVLVFRGLILIPFIGWLIAIVGILLGWGAMLQVQRRTITSL